MSDENERRIDALTGEGGLDLPEPAADLEDGGDVATVARPSVIQLPVRAEGSGLFSRDGTRVAICGTDVGRDRNGPGVAEFLAHLINSAE